MRLFLSSYRAGNHNTKLLDLLGDTREVGVVSNAKDYHQPERRAQRMEEVYDFFRSLEVIAKEIDLRAHFKSQCAEKELAKYKFIWLAGGNVFLLRRALEYSGATNFLIQQSQNDKLILGGESAGALIMGPTLKGSEMEGDSDSPTFIPSGYKSEIIWEGLGLVDFVPVPHFGSEDYGDEINGYIRHLDGESIPYKKMTDNQAIIINGLKEEFLK